MTQKISNVLLRPQTTLAVFSFAFVFVWVGAVFLMADTKDFATKAGCFFVACIGIFGSDYFAARHNKSCLQKKLSNQGILQRNDRIFILFCCWISLIGLFALFEPVRNFELMAAIFSSVFLGRIAAALCEKE